MRKKRVRERDVCFMSKEWEAAIRNKRKYAIQFVKDRTPENFELKKKYRNIATRERRKALTAYLSLIHISEPTRLLSISYAVFCLKKK